MNAAVRACGDHLGDAADRYGSGDVALDVEAVRRALGYDRIDFYAFSYGSVPEQAYAARFPGRVHALVFDAGMSVTDPDHVWAWELGVPRALVRTVSLMCSRDPTCPAGDPGATIRWAVRRTAAEPLRGAVRLPGGKPVDVVIDEAEMANLLRATGTCVSCGQIPPAQLVGAVSSFRSGRPDELLRLAKLHGRGPLTVGPAPTDFSAGDNIAAFCNDQDFVWNRSAPIGVRARKFRAALAALPAAAFAPFSKRGWSEFSWPAGCLWWPAPDRFEPAIPDGAAFPDVPTLILAGDSDTIVPRDVVETLGDEFPDAAFVTVAGAGHPVAGLAWGHCAAELVAGLFDTLEVSDSTCAAVPG
jgi:pimeloyl-ACP methyl ester carboxylesterase